MGRKKIKQDNTFVPYCYYAEVVGEVDGDTIKVSIDIGFAKSWRINVRFAHINTPEKNSTDPVVRAKALQAAAYLAARLPIGTQLQLISRKLDEYGRPLATVLLDGVDINQEMLDKGFAVPYM